jgi:hypothetical protein
VDRKAGKWVTQFRSGSAGVNLLRFHLKANSLSGHHESWSLSDSRPILSVYRKLWPPLWSSGQVSGYRSEVRVRFSALPDFLISSSYGTGSTQPREYNWGAILKKSSYSGLENGEYRRRDPSRWPRGTLYPQKLALISPKNDRSSISIVRSRIEATEFSIFNVGCSKAANVVCKCIWTSVSRTHATPNSR